MPLQVSLPSQWTLAIGNNQFLNLGPFIDGTTIASATPYYVNDLTITVSLYLNRNLQNPSATPGTLVIQWLPGYIGGSNGLYQATISNTFSPVPYLSYALVIDAPLSPSGYQYHAEFPCSVVVRNS